MKRLAKLRPYCVARVGVCLLLVLSAAHAQNAESWHFVNPQPVADPVFSMTWDGSRFVGLGSGGQVLTSPDGIAWSARSEPLATFAIHSLVWNGSKYVGVGIFSTILTSPDAITWTVQQVPVAPSYTFWQVVWNDSRQQFVAVGDSGIILTSTNGSDWVPRASGTVNGLRAITWGNNEYVAVGAAGTVLVSADGINWADHSPQSGPVNASNLMTSIAWDGSTYAVSGFGDPNNVDFPYLGAALATNADPTDAKKWKLRYSDAVSGTFLGHVLWDGSSFVAAGSGGTVLTSSDGTTWNVQNAGTSGEITAIASGGDTLFAATDDSALLTSDLTGVAWTTRSQNFAQSSFEEFTNVVWSGSEFAAVSDAGAFYTSANGLDWAVQGFPFPVLPSGIAWGNGQYVVVGDDSVYASADGAAWNKVTGDETADIEFERVRWGNGRFVAVGSYTPPPPPVFGRLPLGVVFTSTDGVQWTSAGNFADVTEPGDRVHDIIWGGGQFVAVGSSVASSGGLGPTPIFTSANGVDWTRRTVNEFPGPSLRGIAWDGSHYVAVGTPGFGFDPRNGVISADGITWNYVSFPFFALVEAALNSVVWTGKYFVAIGDLGTEVVSPDGQTWTSGYMNSFSSFDAVVTDGLRCIAVGFPSTIMTNEVLCNNDPIFNSGFE